MKRAADLSPEQESWFAEWWKIYWLRKGKRAARVAFAKHVETVERFAEVMTATREQAPEMLAKEPRHRPYGATWLNGERWEDETEDGSKTEPTYPRETF